ncbi:hypothetical protein GQX73_g3960 [Xylaria multiplex]|uniref:Uncharacterized protein n=1 Tax=Xylaria multiplex TaxID=323545 RepID=A0A7C8MVS2_9PEZI|nr:hypothetical protein GQX73_g3960 [Xylaria multiplex]
MSSDGQDELESSVYEEFQTLSTVKNSTPELVKAGKIPAPNLPARPPTPEQWIVNRQALNERLANLRSRTELPARPRTSIGMSGQQEPSEPHTPGSAARSPSDQLALLSMQPPPMRQVLGPRKFLSTTPRPLLRQQRDSHTMSALPAPSESDADESRINPPERMTNNKETWDWVLRKLT